MIIGISELRESGDLGAVGLTAGALGLSVGFSLWWIYFDFVARRPPKPVFLVALTWVYLHLATLTAITATGVGVSRVIADTAGGGLQSSSRYLLVGGVVLGLIGIAALQTTTPRPPPGRADRRELGLALTAWTGRSRVRVPVLEP